MGIGVCLLPDWQGPVKLPGTEKLKPGKFYRSFCNEIWCCFDIDSRREPHMQAYCVRVDVHRIEYFYMDGRYDEAGKREHCLIDCVDND